MKSMQIRNFRQNLIEKNLELFRLKKPNANQIKCTSHLLFYSTQYTSQTQLRLNAKAKKNLNSDFRNYLNAFLILDVESYR